MSPSFDIDAIIAQSKQVEENAKNKPSFVDRPEWDVIIPRWGMTREFKYKAGESDVLGKKMLVVVVGANFTALRWGPKSHNQKTGPYCSVRGYHDPQTGEKITKTHWEIPRPSFNMTIQDLKPWGSRKNPDNESEPLNCADCRAKGLDKSDDKGTFGQSDECGPDGYLDVVVFRHMVEDDNGTQYKNVGDTGFGRAYLAKLPMTNMSSGDYMNYVFGLAKTRRLHTNQIMTEIKVETRKLDRTGTEIATLDFRELDPNKAGTQDFINLAAQLYAEKKEAGKKAAAERRNQAKNPVASTSDEVAGDTVPW